MPRRTECAPCTKLTLSTSCGVVIARAVCADPQYGESTFRVEPTTQSSAHGGFFAGSPNPGLDSPKVNRNLKRLYPAVNSFTTEGENTRRYVSARLELSRFTSPNGGKTRKTSGRATKKTACVVLVHPIRKRPHTAAVPTNFLLNR